MLEFDSNINILKLSTIQNYSYSAKVSQNSILKLFCSKLIVLLTIFVSILVLRKKKKAKRQT